MLSPENLKFQLMQHGLVCRAEFSQVVIVLKVSSSPGHISHEDVSTFTVYQKMISLVCFASQITKNCSNRY